MQEKLTRHLHFLTQDPANINLLIEISQLYQESNDFESAQIYLDKAITLAPEACVGHQGVLYLNQNQLELAKACFLRALTHEESNVLRFHLGFCYFLNHEFEKAQTTLTLLANDASIPEAKILLARLFQRQGLLEEALLYVNQALEHHPNQDEPMGLLSLLYFDLNEEQLARQTAQKALALNPNNYDAKSVDILLRLLTQQTDAAEIEALLAVNPDDARLWFALGNTHLSQGELHFAEEALEKALTCHPDFYDCLLVLAWCQLLNNQLDKAQNNYHKASLLAAELSDAWSGLSLVYALKEELVEAQTLLDKALVINPDCFLAGVAQTICFNYTNPSKAKAQLLHTLKNTNLPAGEKLAIVLESINNK